MASQLDNIPEKWFLPDVINWLAFKYMPHEVYSNNEEESLCNVNIRNSLLELSDYIFDIDQLVSPAFWQKHETEKLYLPPDPRLVQHELMKDGKGYLREPSYYARSAKILLEDTEYLHLSAKQMKLNEALLAVKHKVKLDFDAKKIEIIKNKIDLIIEAIKHQNYKQEWLTELNTKLEHPIKRVIYELTEGSISAEGILLNVEKSDESVFKDNVLWSYNENINSHTSINGNFTNIPTEAWAAGEISWKGSSLTIGNRVYVLARINIQGVLDVFPVSASAPTGNSSQKVRGRPRMRWDRVLAYIIELSPDGKLNIKQDALAFELKLWYQKHIGGTISVSAIHKKLKEYRDLDLIDISMRKK